MSHNPRLGVCIPTYRRPDQLRACVASIIRAAAPFNVPIFIADDSTDDTNVEVIAEAQEQYPHIVHERNAKNLGIDGNILHCADICDCDYAWLIGEDDRMLPDAVATVLPILERETPAFAAVNYSYVDEGIQIVLREALLPIDADRIEDSDRFVRNEAWVIGFIGSCVVNKALWRDVQPEKYLGTYFAHVGVILESIAGRPVFLIAKPLVLNRIGSAEVFTWSGDSYGVFHGWSRVMALLETVYGAETTRLSASSFEAGHGLNTLRFMLAKRADGVYNQGIYERFVKNSDRSRSYKWAAHLIARMPPQPSRVLRALLYQIRRRRNRKLSNAL